MDLGKRAYYSLLGKGVIVLIGGLIWLMVVFFRKCESERSWKFELLRINESVNSLKTTHGDSVMTMYKVTTHGDTLLAFANFRNVLHVTSDKYKIEKAPCYMFECNPNNIDPTLVDSYLIINEKNDSCLVTVTISGKFIPVDSFLVEK